MNTLYSHAIRILACQQCGAPFEASLSGGQFQCQYCSALNQVVQRDEQADRRLAEEGARASISESARFAQLRTQAQSPEPLPSYLDPWLVGARLRESAVPEARSLWQQARQQTASGGGGFSAAERLFYLSVLLAEHLDPRSQRASLETAAELLTDPRHRHVVRCMLARLAAQHGDLDGAEAWLTTCNPRPSDLVMDTAYRHAAATVATARGDFNGVFALLGHHPGEIPLAERERMGCEVLRVNALEKSGHLDAAVREMERWLATPSGELERALAAAGMVEGDGGGVVRAIEAFAPLQVCEHAYQRARHAQVTRGHEQELAELVKQRQEIVTGWRAGLRPLFRLPVLALLLLIPVSATRCAVDVDPLGGVYGVPFCPLVCEGCEGPTRTVTVWRPQGGGEWTSNGAQYFCNAPGTNLERWSTETLEGAVTALSAQEMAWGVASGSSFLILYGILMLFAPVWWYVRHAKGSLAARALDAQIASAAGRLRRAPPATGPPPGGGRVAVIVLAWHGLLWSLALACIGLGLV